MYVIILRSRYATLKWKQQFLTKEEANEFAKSLPGEFEVVKDEEVPADCVEIPVKEEKPCPPRPSVGSS